MDQKQTTASKKQAKEMISHIINSDLNEDDWEILIREEELHALVQSHKILQNIFEEIEEEFKYRTEHDMTGCGTLKDIEYAEKRSCQEFQDQFTES